MLEQLRIAAERVNERTADTAAVLIPNSVTLALIHLIDIKLIGEISLIGLSIAYTIWRWKRDAKAGLTQRRQDAKGEK